MKQLTCEMCGSTDLLKQDGVFVCQTCGCKYSVEEARKMMIEGTVDIQGTVKIDNTEKLAKYYKLARRAKDNADFETAEKYYGLIVEEDPNDGEAVFYELYYNVQRCAYKEMSLNALRFAKSLPLIFKLIAESNKEDKMSIYNEIAIASVNLSTTLTTGFTDWFSKETDFLEKIEILKKKHNATNSIHAILCKCLFEYARENDELMNYLVLRLCEDIINDQDNQGTVFYEVALSIIEQIKPE